MTRTILTPLGPVVVAATDAGVAVCAFADRPRSMAAVPGRTSPAGHAHVDRLRDELAAYFDGRLTRFTVPLDPSPGTPFQRASWAYLASIPFGQTRTYGRQAAAMGAPAAARAVGRANGANRLCLLIPCHRVVGATGALTGFAAGVDRKRWLLEHERQVLAGMTEPGRAGPGRAEPASGALDGVDGGRDPRASCDLRSPRADTARLRFKEPTLDTPSLFA